MEPLDLINHNSGHSHDVEVFWNYWPWNYIIPWFIRWPISIVLFPLTLLFTPHMLIWNFAPDLAYYVVFGVIYAILMVLSALSVVFVWPFYGAFLFIIFVIVAALPVTLIVLISTGVISTGSG